MTPSLLATLVAREKVIRTGRSPTVSVVLAEVGRQFTRAQVASYLKEIDANLARPPLIRREPAYVDELASIQEIQVVLTLAAPAELIEEIKRLMLYVVPDLELKIANLEDRLARVADLNRDYVLSLRSPTTSSDSQTENLPSTEMCDSILGYEADNVMWQALSRPNNPKFKAETLDCSGNASGVEGRAIAMIFARAEQSKKVLRAKIASLIQETLELKAINTQLEALVKK